MENEQKAITPEVTPITENTETKKKRVSYSRFSKWFNCPHTFYLDEVKGLKQFEDTINTCFGTAMHEALQNYVKTLYTIGALEAEALDLEKQFLEVFKSELERAKVEYENDDWMEFSIDGGEILKAFLSVRNLMKHFPVDKYEFISVEDEIRLPLKNNVDFLGYLDLVLKDKVTGKYVIFDFKTSSLGWNPYQRVDPSKTSQLLIYKAVYSKKYKVPMDMIDVQFFIVKRKLLEDVKFPQSRIQILIPPNSQKAVAESLKVFTQFVEDCFNVDGTYNTDISKYPKIPGKNKKHCKYCPHKKTNCDAKSTFSKEELE